MIKENRSINTHRRRRLGTPRYRWVLRVVYYRRLRLGFLAPRSSSVRRIRTTIGGVGAPRSSANTTTSLLSMITQTHRYGMRYPETGNNVSHTQHNTQKQGTYPAGMLSLQIPQKSSRGWLDSLFFLAQKCGVDSSTHRILKIPPHEHSGDARYGNGNSLSEDAAGEPKWSSHLTQSRFACFVVLVFRTRSTFDWGVELQTSCCPIDN